MKTKRISLFGKILKTKNYEEYFFLFFPGLGKEKENTMWKIKEKIANYFPNSELIDFGEVKICSVTNPICDRAKIFADKLSKISKEDSKIISICHSQGGISFLNMIDTLKKNKNDLSLNLRSVIFLGCPFGGNFWAKITKNIFYLLNNKNKFVKWISYFSCHVIKKIYFYGGVEIKDIYNIKGFEDLAPKSLSIKIADEMINYLNTKKIKMCFFHANSDIIVSKFNSLAKHIFKEKNLPNNILNITCKKVGHMGLLFKEQVINKIINNII